MAAGARRPSWWAVLLCDLLSRIWGVQRRRGDGSSGGWCCYEAECGGLLYSRRVGSSAELVGRTAVRPVIPDSWVPGSFARRPGCCETWCPGFSGSRLGSSSCGERVYLAVRVFALSSQEFAGRGSRFGHQASTRSEMPRLENGCISRWSPRHYAHRDTVCDTR